MNNKPKPTAGDDKMMDIEVAHDADRKVVLVQLGDLKLSLAAEAANNLAAALSQHAKIIQPDAGTAPTAANLLLETIEILIQRYRAGGLQVVPKPAAVKAPTKDG